METDLIILTKFECLRPRKLTKISQQTGCKHKLNVKVPRYGNWVFNTDTHVMVCYPETTQRLAKTISKLHKNNVWHKVVQAY